MLQAYRVPRARFIESPPTTRQQRFNPVLPVSTELTPAAVARAISISPFLPSKKLLPRFPESTNCCVERLRGELYGYAPAVPGFISHHQRNLLRTCLLRTTPAWSGLDQAESQTVGGRRLGVEESGQELRPYGARLQAGIRIPAFRP